MSASEKIPLNNRETYGSTAYESLVSTESGVIYCCHGNPATTCCGPDEAQHQPASIMEEHCHQDRDEGIDKVARKKLLRASILCLVFMIAEFAGGIISHSLAIASDAAHLLTDLASFIISLCSLWMASRPRTKRMSFGYYRAEVIGALISVLLIWVVTIVLVYMAVIRVINKEYEINALLMLIIAFLGLLVNIVMGCMLKGVPHGHSHGGGGGHVEIGANAAGGNHEHKGTNNLNVQAAFIHVLGDFLQSLGVLIAAIVIYFRPDWGIVDPICTFIFSVIVLFTTYRIITDALNILMEGTPKGVDFLEVQSILSTIPGVVKVHNLRIWALSMDKPALSAHVAIDEGEESMVVLKKALAKLRSSGINIFDITLQVERYRAEMSECTQCQDPKD